MAFSISLTVRFRDLDPLGHVNNAVFLSYIEFARLEYLASLGVTDADKPSLLLARVEVDFKRPILMRDPVTVTANVTRVGTKSFGMHHDITASGELAASLETVLVWYDHELGQSQPVPDDVRAKFGF
ncbi:MAG: acyl-CoA thioesterase [Pleurocapsa sp. SU_196_0]|nr:acyl-CoA thioesterase [Pleurocapsa sp. SU_196_0]